MACANASEQSETAENTATARVDSFKVRNLKQKGRDIKQHNVAPARQHPKALYSLQPHRTSRQLKGTLLAGIL
jgi:hypothetical protein